MALNYELQVKVKQKIPLKNDFEARTKITGSKTKENEPHTHQNTERRALYMEGEYLYYAWQVCLIECYGSTL